MTREIFPATLMIVLVACAEPKAPPEEPSFLAFEEFPFATTAPNPAVPLCLEAADPDGAPDKVFIDCPLEGESFITEAPAESNTLTFVAFNLERGFRLEEQIVLLSGDGPLPKPDVIMVSEADRGCARTGSRHITRELAQALGMSYLYAVEFVELSRSEDGSRTTQCEHGNALLSRYPLGNARLIRHADQVSWFDAGESRLGGRVAVRADVLIGSKQLRLYSVHFESAISEDPRYLQAREIAEDGLTNPRIAIVGGDFNTGYLSLELENGGDWDLTAEQFLTRGYTDAHASLSLAERITAPSNDFILDLLMASEDVFVDAGVCKNEACQGLSDHFPVWARVKLP
ncbi:MAG: endonuclease/exonuclease/phosphatase family protein [Myxococcota bacterium]|nr:endonuclease/exonuclease/phosphatase family protein [Myxococcota bacterium]